MRCRKIIGSLIFLATRTRPNWEVSKDHLSSHLQNPKSKHMISMKRTLLYLKGISQYAIDINSSNHTQRTAFVNTNWAKDVKEDRQSRSGILLMYVNAVVTSIKNLHESVSLSSTAADYVSLSDASKPIIRLPNIFKELGFPQQFTDASR